MPRPLRRAIDGFASLYLHGNETREQEAVKILFVKTLVVTSCIIGIYGVANMIAMPSVGVVSLVCTAGNILSFTGLVLNVPYRIVAPCTFVLALCATMCADAFTSMQCTRVWVFGFLVVAGALLLTDGGKLLTGLVTTLCVYLALHAFDSSVTLFLTSIRDDVDAPSVDVCSCMKPPCAIPVATAFNRGAVDVFVFLVNFTLTREFVRQARTQVTLIKSAVEVSRLVTVHLSRYEVAEAQEVVFGEGGDSLPKDLREAYVQLLSNLEHYRPYLPMSCFADADDEVEGGEISGWLSVTPTFGPGDKSVPSFFAATSSPRRSSDGGSALGQSLRFSCAPRQEPKPRTLTMLVLNYRGTLKSDLTSIGSWVEEAVSRFENHVLQWKGVVDHLSVDHYFASFNGARGCLSHRYSGTRCGWAATESDCRGLQATGALACGRMMCGDLGTQRTLRYMSVGATASVLLMLERVGSQWELRLVLDRSVREEAESHYHCRICAFARFPAKVDGSFALWTATDEREDVEPGQEWMYEVQTRARDDRWSKINEAMCCWVSGAKLEAELLARDELERGRSQSSEEEARRLLMWIQTEEEPMRVYVEGFGQLEDNVSRKLTIEGGALRSTSLSSVTQST
eukprot:TRINITY_DN17107_c0_g1_i1.p1 TRINITY_DN17107_c0_g1~~TRINITY_DN17107_c0_g1_i1.p1  ORF type:complete len:641 (+),score=101.35 TRINITY_DN17107_c0_g1_i1:47-1924(+)